MELKMLLKALKELDPNSLTFIQGELWISGQGKRHRFTSVGNSLKEEIYEIRKPKEIRVEDLTDEQMQEILKSLQEQLKKEKENGME